MISQVATTPVPFIDRYFSARLKYGPLVMGIDPSADLLAKWGLPDSPTGLSDFCRICLEAAVGNVGLVKFQSAFFERQGCGGLEVLRDSLKFARLNNLLVILDAKRGDIGNTAFSYGETYFRPNSDFFTDAVTVSPYLGVRELMPIFEKADAVGGYVFVVARSSNFDARTIQGAKVAGNLSVEESVMTDIVKVNKDLFFSHNTQFLSASDGESKSDMAGEYEIYLTTKDAVGAVGAVLAPNCQEPLSILLQSLKCLFLVPGIGAQGATLAQTADLFRGCINNALPSLSRGILFNGPDIDKIKEGIIKIKTDIEKHFNPPA